MKKLSVVIATRNEEENIGDCLESVKWADEIIIVDDSSTDRTVEIAKKYTGNIFTNDSKGSFHENKNLGIDKALGEWILSLDADERVSGELREEINEAVNATGKVGYFVRRKNYFLGKWIQGCGWWPDDIIRLFKKGAAKWPKDIHSTPVISRRDEVGCLKGPIEHYSYRSLDQYFEKFNRYTSRLAEEEFAKGTKMGGPNFFINFLIKPQASFLRKYFLWMGFRDGFRGLFISLSSALVIFTTYAKLWEREKGRR